jgi:Cdc6-like AAA superfamily ATPase
MPNRLIPVNYLKHLTGKDDELQSIQDQLKQLEPKETLYAAIETLKVSISTNDALQKMVLNREDDKVLSWLSSNTSQKNHGMARKKHEPTTGNWFLQSETFMKWSNATKSSLWLYGKAGSGKTILCSTIIDHIIEKLGSTSNGAQCAYFYFDFQTKWKDDDMLRSIIAQLCAGKNNVPRELHHLYQQCCNGQQQPRKASLLEILSLLTISSRNFIVVDALDECMASAGRADLLETIEEMVKGSKHLNVLVTSRKERDIEKKLKILFEYNIALEENVIDSDIALHIQEALKNDTELSSWDPDSKKDIEQTLIKGARGMYYYLNI